MHPQREPLIDSVSYPASGFRSKRLVAKRQEAKNPFVDGAALSLVTIDSFPRAAEVDVASPRRILPIRIRVG